MDYFFRENEVCEIVATNNRDGKLMNIIIHRYNSICEPDYIDSFKKLGINVIEDRAEMDNKNTLLEERIRILGEMILSERPLFVFTINFFPYIAMVCEKLKCFYVCVSVDCPVVELFSETIKSRFNRVFLFDKAQYEEVRIYNPECVFHISLGVNVDRINTTLGEPIWNNYKYDVSFVGSLYNEKDALEQILPKLPMKEMGYCTGLLAAQSLFGGQDLLEECISNELIHAIKINDKNFYPSKLCVKDTDRFVAVNNYLSYHLTAQDRALALNRFAQVADIHLFTRSNTEVLKGVCCHGGVSSLVEMPQVFRESKINLNMTMRAIKTGLPQRIWDIMGSGGFLMTNYQAEIPELLEVGKHLVAYETIEEACELIQYYLAHEEERLEIACNGYEFVKNNHTVINRVTEMIRIITDTLKD